MEELNNFDHAKLWMQIIFTVKVPPLLIFFHPWTLHPYILYLKDVIVFDSCIRAKRLALSKFYFMHPSCFFDVSS